MHVNKYYNELITYNYNLFNQYPDFVNLIDSFNLEENKSSNDSELHFSNKTKSFFDNMSINNDEFKVLVTYKNNILSFTLYECINETFEEKIIVSFKEDVGFFFRNSFSKSTPFFDNNSFVFINEPCDQSIKFIRCFEKIEPFVFIETSLIKANQSEHFFLIGRNLYPVKVIEGENDYTICFHDTNTNFIEKKVNSIDELVEIFELDFINIHELNNAI